MLRYAHRGQSSLLPFFGVGRNRAICNAPRSRRPPRRARPAVGCGSSSGGIASPRTLLEDMLPQLETAVFQRRIEVIDAHAGGHLVHVAAAHVSLHQERLRIFANVRSIDSESSAKTLTAPAGTRPGGRASRQGDATPRRRGRADRRKRAGGRFKQTFLHLVPRPGRADQTRGCPDSTAERRESLGATSPDRAAARPKRRPSRRPVGYSTFARASTFLPATRTAPICRRTERLGLPASAWPDWRRPSERRARITEVTRRAATESQTTAR